MGILNIARPDFFGISLFSATNFYDFTLVMLALTNHQENLLVVELLKEIGYRGKLAAVVRFSEEAEELEAHGVSAFNLYAQAGAGFAEHASALVGHRRGEIHPGTNEQS